MTVYKSNDIHVTEPNASDITSDITFTIFNNAWLEKENKIVCRNIEIQIKNTTESCLTEEIQ